MKKIILSFALFLLSFMGMFSQNVGINSTGASPDASAILDVDATSKGLLIPRVALTGTGDVITIPSAAISLLVYNIATATDVTPGYYYWDGVKWIRLIENGTPSGADWSLMGNAGTTAGTNFLGTTDAQDLAIYTNNVEKIRVTSAGNIGIGTTTPSTKLEIAGQVKITGGAPGTGKVLTSDATGVATWTNTGIETSGTFTAIAHMFPAGANIVPGNATLTFNALGTYVKQGSLVYISITGLPTNVTCDGCTFETISGLPFPAVAASNLSMGHARGVVWRYGALASSYFLVEPRIDITTPSRISMSSSKTETHYSGYIGLRTSGGQSTFISSVSGCYITTP